MTSASVQRVAPAEAQFDSYSADYESALAEGLQFAGEGPEFFARKRVDWVARLVGDRSISGRRLLDFGCGIGLAIPHLRRAFSPSEVWGYDPSSAAVSRARSEFGDDQTIFTANDHAVPTGRFDGAYVNGVFHHIPPADRRGALAIVRRSLKTNGWFAFWENNPWNPGTRFIMNRVPFDRDAVTISPWEARRLLRSAGFRVVRTDAWFLFPRALAWLRPLEYAVHRVPLGGQYLVLARKQSI